MKYLFFDTETTGLPKNREDAIKGPGNWPHIVSLSWQVYENNKHIKSESYIIKPMEWRIHEDSIKIHGITNEKALLEGHDLLNIINKFMNEKADYLIAHNVDFDYNVIMNAILWDLRLAFPTFGKLFCTMKNSREIMKIPYANGLRGYKPPKLIELYEFVLKKKPDVNKLHSSSYDTQLLVDIVMNYEPFKQMLNLTTMEIKEVNEISNKKRKRGTLFL